MKRNEKILVAVLLCVVVGYFGRNTIDSIFLAPTREARQTLNRTEQQVGDQEYELMDLKTAEVQIGEWSGAGLPSDPSTGQRLYILWLREAAALSDVTMTVEKGARTRAGSAYTAVRATLTGHGTFTELKNFLDIFRRVDLMHRIVSLEVGPAGSAEGNPRLPIEMVVEGLSIPNAVGTPETTESEGVERPQVNLFPRAKLPSELKAGETELASFGESLPAKVGDRLRVGEELIGVVEAGAETLMIERGINGTTAATHGKDAEIALYPSRANAEELAQLARMRSPFVKAHDYSPRFEGLNDLRVVRGETLETKVGLKNADPLLGEPTIVLEDGPEGLTFDATTGTLHWSPGADLPAKPYRLRLTAKQPGADKAVEEEVTVELAEPNSPPSLPSVESRTALHGETLEWDFAASDEESPEDLTYALEGAPEGMSIDEQSGMLTWAVPSTATPGGKTFSVKVTDSGEPALSASRELTVTVKENLKPYVYLVGTTRNGTEWDAWLWDRSEGKRISLYEGKPFEAVGISGTVEAITAHHVILAFNGGLWRLELGENLGDMAKMQVSPVSAIQIPVEAPQPGETVLAAGS